jgi:hypothetical protein
MGLFDIDRFNESNALCGRGEGCKRDGPIHRLYKQDMAAISKIGRIEPCGGDESQSGAFWTHRDERGHVIFMNAAAGYAYCNVPPGGV